MRRVRGARLPNPVIWDSGGKGGERIQLLKARGGGDYSGGGCYDGADRAYGSGGDIDIGLVANANRTDVATATSVNDSMALTGACGGDSEAGRRDTNEGKKLTPLPIPCRHDADGIAREYGPPRLRQDQPGQGSTEVNVNSTSSRSAVGGQHSPRASESTVQPADIPGESYALWNRIDITFRKTRDYLQEDGIYIWLDRLLSALFFRRPPDFSGLVKYLMTLERMRAPRRTYRAATRNAALQSEFSNF